ncbi:multiple monosaccharide ABC transporter substrate-binding protein [Actinacidiphila glaucinigra]|uniref:multiple monosaccharide ABC transporter substrate-binding protein n=1 Tax=Actinacidiphila glaucinigra TaxID=235986 RepID=UPI0029AAE5E0|nr:sugar ABC transporter substrate-binding protein [Streptomyces sp. PA03-3a]
MRIARAARLRTTAALIATLALGATATACGQSDNTGGGDKDGGKGTIGIAMPTKSSERWIADGDNMVKLFKEQGYKTDLQYGDDKVENQVAQIQNMITKGDKLLVVAAIDGSALSDVLQQAHDAGIKVISYDRLILGSENVDYYATFDNYKVGVLQADYIIDKLGLKDGSKKGPFNIELFAGSPDDNNTKYFFNGAMDTLKPYIEKKQLVVKSGQTELNQVTTLRWDGATAQARMDDLLSKSYTSDDVDAVLSPYDGISRGIISALKSVSYGTGKKPLPVVTGQDAEVASIKSIIAGEQAQTVYKDTRELAKVAVQMGNAVLTGGKPEINDSKTYDNGTKVVPTYLLPPVSVDKSNYKEAVVDSGYIKESELQ